MSALAVAPRKPSRTNGIQRAMSRGVMGVRGFVRLADLSNPSASVGMKNRHSYPQIVLSTGIAALLVACAGPSSGTKDASAPSTASRLAAAAAASTSPTMTALTPPQSSAPTYPNTMRGDVVDNYH